MKMHEKDILINAMLNGSEEELLNLINFFSVVDLLDIEDNALGANIFLHAAMRGFIKLAQELISRFPEEKDKFLSSVHSEHVGGMYMEDAFLLAARKGQLEIMKWLFKQMPSLIKDRPGMNPLVAAAGSGNLKLIKWILKKNPNDFKPRDHTTHCPFQQAAFYGKLEVMKWLMEERPDIINTFLVEPTYEEAAFLYAAQRGHLEVMKWLLGRNREVIKAVNYYKKNVFLYAAEGGHLKIMEWLLEQHANFLTSTDDYRNNAFLWAVKGGHIKVMEWLIEKKTEFIDSVANYKKNAFILAVENDDIELALVDWLLRKKPGFINSLIDRKNAWMVPPNITFALLFLAYDIGDFLPLDQDQVEWLNILELKNRGEFNSLRIAVNAFGISLVITEINQYIRLKNMPDELQFYVAEQAIDCLIKESAYPHICATFIKNKEILELLMQRCAREMIDEYYPDLKKEYSPEIDYIEELRQIVFKDNIWNTLNSLAIPVIKAYKADMKLQATLLEKIISWAQYIIEKMHSCIYYILGESYETDEDKDTKIKAHIISQAILPIFEEKLEPFDWNIFPELRIELTKTMYKALLRHSDLTIDAIIEGVGKVLDTIPKSYIETYATRAGETQRN